MASPNLFGVSKADIQSVCTNLSIESDTSPSEAQVNELIEQAAAEIYLEAQAVGIDINGLTDPTQAMYMIFKRAIVYRVAADVLTAKNRGNPESGQYYIERHNEMLDKIRKFPDRTAERGENDGPNRLKVLDYDDIQENTTFASSMAGRIILGRSL